MQVGQGAVVQTRRKEHVCIHLRLYRRSREGEPRPDTALTRASRTASRAAQSGSARRGGPAQRQAPPARPRLVRPVWAGPAGQAGHLQLLFRFQLRFQVRFPPIIFPIIFLSSKTLLKKMSEELLTKLSAGIGKIAQVLFTVLSGELSG